MSNEKKREFFDFEHRYEEEQAKHRYSIEAVDLRSDKRLSLVIDANNRSQAGFLAKLYGYRVLSVNMVG